jgi:hypothetical protein
MSLVVLDMCAVEQATEQILNTCLQYTAVKKANAVTLSHTMPF